MADIETPPTPSPWHAGERRMHERLGVAERMEQFGRQVVRNFMPDQHRAFFRQLPFLIVGAVDDAGAPWATLLEGTPGFVASPDPKLLRIDALPGNGDPVGTAIAAGSPVGLLGIELHTRRRNRMNGTVSARDGAGFSVAVEHAFGNCPQYIQNRSLAMAPKPAPSARDAAERKPGLDDAARATIAAADTFFVASYADIDADLSRRAVDVSHRGGRPGFVRIDGDVLTVPDFAGNLHFNTIGNLLLNPRAGLLFFDFASGDLLQLTGTCEIVLEGGEIAAFQGAERLWRFTVSELVRRRRGVSLRGSFADYSPNTLLTGSWEEAAARQRAEALRHSWRPFRIARIVEESTSIRSFHLEPEDGAGTPHFEAGQYLPIRLCPSPKTPPLIRAYTLSVAPADRGLRISVKRDGAASQHLHDRMAVGDRIEARAPDGAFTIDTAESRPAVLLSAGVGITPMLAMLRHIVFEGLRTRRFRPTFFIHGSRTKAERPFDAELAALTQQGQGAIAVVRVLSEPEPAAVSGADYDHRGRIDTRLLKAVLPLDDYDFYLCGPAAFTQGLYAALRALRIPDDRIRAEAFGPSTLVRTLDPGTASALPALAPPEAEPVQVLFARSAKEARWTPATGTLLDLAESRGLTPEFSCRTGTCGTCRTRVLEGEVTYASRPTATPGAGSGLICCAVPAAGGARRIVLDL
jgi:hypothetical protein